VHYSKKRQVLVISIENFWVMWLQSFFPTSWGVPSPDPHRRVGRGTWLPSIAQSCQSRVFLASSLLRGGWVKVKAAALLPLTHSHIRCNARGARLQIRVTTSSCLGQRNMLVIHEKLLFLKTWNFHILLLESRSYSSAMSFCCWC
jgi:hypothetical protein